MIETIEFFNLQLCELEQMLLQYYKEKLDNEDLKIETKIVKVLSCDREVQFKLLFRKKIELDMIVKKDYILEQKDINEAINSYLNKENYKVICLNYEFYEFRDDVSNIKLFVKRQKENKLKKILTINKKRR